MEPPSYLAIAREFQACLTRFVAHSIKLCVFFIVNAKFSKKLRIFAD